nr:immunoglobulin light chain junction region [Macaca mulatta]MOW39557.1 immunoglobulin light chain junction region [Macaca mulatta]MOW63963.1 immunoglobulin light chain junction region [Macaca mulatta]MOW74137.1 immunoglobulin light chain junction region [Macaca mulatta]MOY01518.1 immunoglobulin light chain junction region [Macaca mulatta]
CGQGTHLPYTF